MILASDPDFFDLLVSSYRRTVGSEPAFLEHGQHHSAKWLYQTASHPVLAHNTDPDPRFIYANKAAQAAFEYDWEEITELPSRLSAEPVDLRGSPETARCGRPPRLCHWLFRFAHRQVRSAVLDRGWHRVAAHQPRWRRARPGRDLRPLA